MNKASICAILSGLILLIQTGCVNAPSRAGGLKSFSTETVMQLLSGNAESPQMTIGFDLLDTSDDNKVGALLRARFYEGLDASQYADEVTAKLQKQYEEAHALFEEQPDASASLDWEYKETVTVTTVPGRDLPLKNMAEDSRPAELLVVDRTKESFLGGAHGAWEKQYLVIDPVSAKALAPEDFFNEDELAALQSRVTAALAVSAGLEPGTPLKEGGFFTDEIELTGNFFVTKSGPGFHWNEYEIAPYSQGPIEVIIPWQPE